MVQIQIDKIKDLIKANLIEDALGILLSHAPSVTVQDDVIILFRQNSLIEDEKRKGCISFDKYKIETNLISYSILNLLRKIEANNTDFQILQINFQKTETNEK